VGRGVLAHCLIASRGTSEREDGWRWFPTVPCGLLGAADRLLCSFPKRPAIDRGDYMALGRLRVPLYYTSTQPTPMGDRFKDEKKSPNMSQGWLFCLLSAENSALRILFVLAMGPCCCNDSLFPSSEPFFFLHTTQAFFLPQVYGILRESLQSFPKSAQATDSRSKARPPWFDTAGAYIPNPAGFRHNAPHHVVSGSPHST
jgi:hypothetical protein